MKVTFPIMRSEVLIGNASCGSIEVSAVGYMLRYHNAEDASFVPHRRSFPTLREAKQFVRDHADQVYHGIAVQQ